MNQEKITYIKLSDLVGDQFTVEKAGGYNFKKWDDNAKRMLISETYQEGYRKVYTVDTDKGRMDLGSGQISSLLEAVYKNGVADITNRTFTVKSNGKTGMDIRYFFNAVREDRPSSQAWDKAREKFNKDEDIVIDDEDLEKPIDLSDIPF